MRPEAAEKDRCEPIGGTRRFDALLAFVLAVGTLLLSICVIGAKLFLVSIYGWSRVRAEVLYLVSTPNGRPRVVSNGDLLESSSAPLRYQPRVLVRAVSRDVSSVAVTAAAREDSRITRHYEGLLVKRVF